MKFVVTAISIQRNGYKVNPFYRQTDGSIAREEIVDPENNVLFEGMTDVYEIEGGYEAFWNRLNGGYTNREIVKVLNVVPVQE